MTNKPTDDRPIELRLTDDAMEALSKLLSSTTFSVVSVHARNVIKETAKLAWANGHATGRLQTNPNMTSIKENAQQVYVRLHANNHTPSRTEIHKGLEDAVRLGIVYQINKQLEADERSESERVRPEFLRLNTVEVMLHDSTRGDEATVVQIDTEGPARLRIRVNDEAVMDFDPDTGRDYLARPEITTDDVMASIGAMLGMKYGITMETGHLTAVAKQTAEMLDEVLETTNSHTKRSDSEQEAGIQ